MRFSRGTITRQAAERLLVTLGLFICVTVVAAVTLYRAAIEKAASKRADDLAAFYQSRLLQQEREWELEARRLRVRIEYTRLLEEPRTAALNLQAFMTLQGGDDSRYVAIQNARGEVVFRFGPEMPERLPRPLTEGMHYFLDNDRDELFRVFDEPVWLGPRGMGRMWVFFRMDNALLGRLAVPEVTLTARYQGSPVASSVGLRGITSQAVDLDKQVRALAWSGRKADAAELLIGAPERVLFTPLEMAVAASVIPILTGLILWFTLGTWLMRQARRINSLEQALGESTDGADGYHAMERKLREASAGMRDEIHAVAETLRRTTAQRDVAERRIVALNDELKGRNGQLESLNAELESFIYSVSHDLRAPLRAIAGYSAILEEDYRDHIDETGREFLQRLSVNAERMAQRIDDLLYLSRISRQEMERAQVDLGPMAAGVVAELRERSPERSVEVTIGEGMTAFADPRLMTVALSNLIANAWKFTQRRTDARIEIGTTDCEGEKCFWIRDNGAGFEPELARRLFLPFQRLHSDAEFEGTGLGLAIVERVIRRHGGRIWAEGAPEQGAVFRFTL
jgi:signal transduction histidine kinase